MSSSKYLKALSKQIKNEVRSQKLKEGIPVSAEIIGIHYHKKLKLLILHLQEQRGAFPKRSLLVKSLTAKRFSRLAVVPSNFSIWEIYIPENERTIYCNIMKLIGTSVYSYGIWKLDLKTRRWSQRINCNQLQTPSPFNHVQISKLLNQAAKNTFNCILLFQNTKGYDIGNYLAEVNFASKSVKLLSDMKGYPY